MTPFLEESGILYKFWPAKLFFQKTRFIILKSRHSSNLREFEFFLILDEIVFQIEHGVSKSNACRFLRSYAFKLIKLPYKTIS